MTCQVVGSVKKYVIALISVETSCEGYEIALKWSFLNLIISETIQMGKS